jgi:hypothetical protein
MSKVMNHRIEKLSPLLDANETQFNMENKNEITIQREVKVNETNNVNSCSSTIKLESLSMPKPNRFKSNSFIRKHKCETCEKRFHTSTKFNKP